MVLNETIMQFGSLSEILIEVHSVLVIPELIILYFFSSLIFLFVGLALIDTEKSDYSKFLKIFFISQLIIVTFILLPLLFLPTTVHGALESIKTSLNFG